MNVCSYLCECVFVWVCIWAGMRVCECVRLSVGWLSSTQAAYWLPSCRTSCYWLESDGWPSAPSMCMCVCVSVWYYEFLCYSLCCLLTRAPLINHNPFLSVFFSLLLTPFPLSLLSRSVCPHSLYWILDSETKLRKLKKLIWNTIIAQ